MRSLARRLGIEVRRQQAEECRVLATVTSLNTDHGLHEAFDAFYGIIFQVNRRQHMRGGDQASDAAKAKRRRGVDHADIEPFGGIGEILLQGDDGSSIAAIDIRQGAVGRRQRDTVVFASDNPGRRLEEIGRGGRHRMLLERVCRVALRINIDHQNPAASFRHEPGQMHSKRRLADAALLIVDDDRVHRLNPDETICARFIDFPPPACRTYRPDLDETGLLIPGCWFEPTPLMDQRVAHNPENRAQNPLPEESGRPSQKKEGADSKPVHITGQATVLLTKTTETGSAAAPCPVGLNQHVLGPSPGYDVRNGRKDETEPKPRDADRGLAPRGTRPKAKNFGGEGQAQGIPAEPRLLMDAASEKSSPAVDRAVDDHGYPAMRSGATTRAEEDPMIITFPGSRKVGNIACNAAERHPRPLKPASGKVPGLPIAQARRFSWSRELICDIRIGPRENSPTSAFRVSPRK